MGEACRALGTPIVSGNVSFYNDTLGESIFPTPTIGMVGLLKDATRHGTSWFKNPGDVVFLLGELSGTLGGSEYLSFIQGERAGQPPALDLHKEKATQDFVLKCLEEGLVLSAHDVSDGGLAIALAESCLAHPERSLGLEAVLPDIRAPLAIHDLLFGEGASRIVLSTSPAGAGALAEAASAAGLKLTRIGAVAEKEFILNPWLRLPIDEMKRAWDSGLERVLCAE
jgi:phosphoribosylformylglycinamidine synthase